MRAESRGFRGRQTRQLISTPSPRPGGESPAQKRRRPSARGQAAPRRVECSPWSGRGRSARARGALAAPPGYGFLSSGRAASSTRGALTGPRRTGGVGVRYATRFSQWITSQPRPPGPPRERRRREPPRAAEGEPARRRAGRPVVSSSSRPSGSAGAYRHAALCLGYPMLGAVRTGGPMEHDDRDRGGPRPGLPTHVPLRPRRRGRARPGGARPAVPGPRRHPGASARPQAQPEDGRGLAPEHGP